MESYIIPGLLWGGLILAMAGAIVGKGKTSKIRTIITFTLLIGATLCWASLLIFF